MIQRGEIYLLAPPPDPSDPKLRRACVVVSRKALCESRFGKVVVAAIHSDADGLSTEVALGVEDGMKWTCVIKADQLFLIEKARLTNFVASLRAPKLRRLNHALSIALDLA
jgi:mRNA-degrading endonuclease toxin of MazEF toxin-antitoxin module